MIRSLDALRDNPKYTEQVKSDSPNLEKLFEETFHHAQFTGRSGTFFAYEGLGGIYWHMVSKLLLAVQETIMRTRNEPSTPSLIENYLDIRKGLSFNKTPENYRAFPTDPYSHTPKGQGAKQPGMTGMVKEEILTRQQELGLPMADGKLSFDHLLLDRKEFLEKACHIQLLEYRWTSETGRFTAGVHRQHYLPGPNYYSGMKQGNHYNPFQGWKDLANPGS